MKHELFSRFKDIVAKKIVEISNNFYLFIFCFYSCKICFAAQAQTGIILLPMLQKNMRFFFDEKTKKSLSSIKVKKKKQTQERSHKDAHMARTKKMSKTEF